MEEEVIKCRECGTLNRCRFESTAGRGTYFCKRCGKIILYLERAATIKKQPLTRHAEIHATPLQSPGEFCELRCDGFFGGHRWKAFGVLRRGRYFFNDEDTICPRCGRKVISAISQADAMIQAQKTTNLLLLFQYLFRR